MFLSLTIFQIAQIIILISELKFDVLWQACAQAGLSLPPLVFIILYF